MYKIFKLDCGNNFGAKNVFFLNSTLDRLFWAGKIQIVIVDFYFFFLCTVNHVQKLYYQMIWLSKWKFRDLPRNLTNEFGYNEWNVFSMLEVNEAHVKDFYLQVISQDFFFFSLERTYAQLSTNIDGVHNNAQRFVASISKK